MYANRFVLLCASLICIGVAVFSQGFTKPIPKTRFTCYGRPSGYYADMDTGCQVYHMCDGLGRQFSYTCPNTTLFQQRMLICDHWYMVNCSKSEQDYGANLLIGQRDKPFVSDAEMQFRTPRPDILSVPPNNNYFEGLKEAETKYPEHPGNSIVGVADSISNANNNGLDSAKQHYRPPSSWSTGTGNRRPTSNDHFNNPTQSTYHDNNEDTIASAASLKPTPKYENNPNQHSGTNFIPTSSQNHNTNSNVPPLNTNLLPPFSPTPSNTKSSEEYELDIRMKNETDDPVYNFINRFDPNSPDSHKTAMTTSEILNINQQLPQEQEVSAEVVRTKKLKNTHNQNTLKNDDKNTQPSRFDSANIKPTVEAITEVISNGIPVPDKNLLPPKSEYSNLPSTTMGPPIYYEWKWAVPAFDLEPPKVDNSTANINITEVPQGRSTGQRPFSNNVRSDQLTTEPDLTPSNTEYNISSYFVPDYMFPLDKPHPGYDNDGAQTSFQVSVGREGKSSFGENPNCPHCHPAYLKPGTCEPCIVKR